MDKIEEGRETNECMSTEDRQNSCMTDISSWEVEDTGFSICPELEKETSNCWLPSIVKMT